MAKERFLYLPQVNLPDESNPQGFTTYRPVVLARVRSAAGQVARVPMILDSGADSCVLPTSAAKGLNLDLASHPQSLIMGVGGTYHITYVATVMIDLGRGLTFSTRIEFSDGLNRIGYGLLGQSSFFERFHVEFRLADGYFTIEPAEAPAVQ